MIQTALFTSNILYPDKKWEIFLTLFIDTKYFISATVFNFDTEEKTNVDCSISILGEINKENIFKHRFFDRCGEYFVIDNFEPTITSGRILCRLECEMQHYEKNAFIIIEIYLINDFIDLLNCDEEIKEKLWNIVNHYLKPQNVYYDSVINEICIFGEFIARDFAEKAKNQPFKDFKPAVDALMNFKDNNDINYNYIGSLLYPIYYARIQKLHAYPKIEFFKAYAEMLFRSLFEIIRYLTEFMIEF